MPEKAFTTDVMSISVEGLAAAQRRLDKSAEALSASGLRRPMILVTGQTHRYMMGLKRSGTPPTAQGILPVVSSRLANSFFWQVHQRGRGIITGLVGSNVDYGPQVEQRRGFLRRTVRDQEGPINAILSAHVRQVTR